MDLKKIKLFVLVFAVCLLYVATAKPRQRKKKGDTSKATKLNQFRSKLSTDRRSGQINFPDEMEFDFIVDGEPRVRSRSRKLPKSRSIPTFDSSRREHKRDRTNQRFYIDDTGSYQVSATARSDGSVDSDLKALYKNSKGEKCFFARGESNCWKIDGKRAFGEASLEADMIEIPLPYSIETRKKRQLVYSDFTPNRVYKVVYVADRQFMECSEADDTIPDMDITVYAQGFYYPALGKEWRWLRPWISSNTIDAYTNGTGALPDFGRWVGAGYVDKSGPFDTLALLTPRILSTSGYRILGLAYPGTVCEPIATNYKVSMNQDKNDDTARILAHELGHAIGGDHDTSDECPNYTNLMATHVFPVRPSTRDTWKRWSTCSVRDIIAHVSKYTDCLLDEDISNDDFYDQLCTGVRGGSDKFDINYQCKAFRKIETSAVCSPSETVSSGKIPARACWEDSVIQCTNANDVCSYRIYRVYDGTSCIGSDSTKDYVCYLGDCLEKADVCAGRPTAAPPVCSCAILKGPLRTQCCRAGRNSDNSCCYGCKPNTRNTSCISDWLI